MDKVKKLITLLILIAVLGGGYLYKKLKDSESKLPSPTFINADLEIETPYAFMTIANAKTGAAFMTIKNPNNTDDELLSATSLIAEHTEIHQNIIDPDDGKMMMRKISSLNIPGKKEVSLDPKGYHIMLINLKQALKIGDEFPLDLSFKNLGDIQVKVQVIAAGTTPQHNHNN